MLLKAAMRSVLIVDDSDTLRGAFKKLFDDSGWSVVEGKNGREALTMADTYHPSVVVLDISMPEMDGIHAAELLKSQSPETQIIVCSLYAMDEDIIRALYRAGIRNVLSKTDAFQHLVPTAEKLSRQPPMVQ
jgi:two-component system chemotaxis response regulator CheY